MLQHQLAPAGSRGSGLGVREPRCAAVRRQTYQWPGYRWPKSGEGRIGGLVDYKGSNTTVSITTKSPTVKVVHSREWSRIGAEAHYM